MFVFLKKISPLFLMILIAVGFYLYKQKDNYIKGNEINIVQFADVSGFNAQRTLNFDYGVEAYFRNLNENGGVGGRKVIFRKIDNKGEKDLSLDKIYEIKDTVASFFGFVDFYTSKVVLETAAGENRPFLMPFCSADFLKREYERFYYSFTPSIEDEIDALLEYLASRDIKSFCILYEDDICMRNLVKEVKNMAKDKRMDVEESLFYKKNTYLFSDIYKRLSELSPKAVLVLGSYKEISVFLKKISNDIVFSGTFFLIPSYIGIDAFSENFKNDRDINLIFSQPVFSPFEDKFHIVKEYRKVFKKYYPKKEFGFDSLKGYLYAKIFSLAMESARKEISGKKILYFLKNIPYIKYNRENLIEILNENGTLNKVYLFRYKEGKLFEMDAG